MPTKTKTPYTIPTDRSRIDEMVTGYRSAKILFVAAKLKVFDTLKVQAASSKDLARSLRLNARAAETFLDALTALGFLLKTKGMYNNARITQKFLVADSVHYVGDNLKYQDFLWDSWSELEHVLKTGTPSKTLDMRLEGEQAFVQEYIRGMRDINRAPAAELANALGPIHHGVMLDIGGGAGTFTLALLDQNKNLQADILDLPETLQRTREFIEPAPQAERVRLLEGSYHETHFGREKYSLILLSHVTHNENEEVNRDLIRRCYDALLPKGRLVIHDFMSRADGTSPLFSALFSVHMMVSTRGGKTYRRDEYARWLNEAGFAKTKSIMICSNAVNATEALIGHR